jgi:hypothetical protein
VHPGVYAFRLFLADGSDVGTFATGSPDWEPGEVFFDGHHREGRVVLIASADGGLYRALFVVEPVER